MKIFSETTGKCYEDEDCVFFRNYVQSGYYIEWGAELVDVFTDSSHKLVFVFTKADHNRLKEKWGTKKENKVIE